MKIDLKNNKINLFDIIAIFITVLLFIALFLGTDQESIPLDCLTAFVVSTFLYVFLKKKRERSEKFIYYVITWVTLFYIDILLLVDDFAEGFISDIGHIILMTPPALLGIYFFAKAFKNKIL